MVRYEFNIVLGQGLHLVRDDAQFHNSDIERGEFRPGRPKAGQHGYADKVLLDGQIVASDIAEVISPWFCQPDYGV